MPKKKQALEKSYAKEPIEHEERTRRSSWNPSRLSSLPKFDESKVSWEVYQRRLENAFQQYEFPVERQTLALLDSIGETTYAKLVDKQPKRNFQQHLWGWAKRLTRSGEAGGTTAGLVQWMHREELWRLQRHQLDEGHRGPWTRPWKCVVLYSEKNKYGRTHYTFVDVCTLQHEDGKESEPADWRSHLIHLIQSRRPARIYAVNVSPFEVSDQNYYRILTATGYLEVYLEPEQELQDILLRRVWEGFLAKISYQLQTSPTTEYTSMNKKSVLFRKDVKPTGTSKFQHLRFLEKFEIQLPSNIIKQLNTYKSKQDNNSSLGKLSSFMIHEQLSEENVHLQKNYMEFPKNSLLNEIYIGEKKFRWLREKKYYDRIQQLGGNNITEESNKNMDGEYAEYLKRKEYYLSEVEKMDPYFSKHLEIEWRQSSEKGEDPKGDRLTLYADYLYDWRDCGHQLIFNGEGRLYERPAEEVSRAKEERRNVIQLVASGRHAFLELFLRRRMLRKWAEGRQPMEQRYWHTRRRYMDERGWTEQDWASRRVERRQYSTGFEWFKQYYPGIYRQIR